MPEYAYTTVTGKTKPLLEKIRTVGVPPKVTEAWLKTLGFKSTNDRTLIGVLKFIGLIDQAGIPTARWSAYRANHRTVLGEAIRSGYADLYAVYPDAHTRSNTELQHVFSTSSSAGQQVVGKTVKTFKALVEEAEFPRMLRRPKPRCRPAHCIPRRQRRHRRSPASHQTAVPRCTSTFR